MSVEMVRTLCTVCAVGMLAQANSDTDKYSMRGRKCIIKEDLDHDTRSALYQDCIKKSYNSQDKDTHCYSKLGCFSNKNPWTNMLRPFPPPLPPAEINTNFYCYTRDSEKRFNIDIWPKISINACPFDAEKTTAFITHGFASNGNFSWVLLLKDRYLEQVDANVFVVDWGHGAQLHNYLQVAANTRIVGAELARFILCLIRHHGLKPSSVHLMGHSLGAHASAYAAKKVGNINRITAFDPAQPGFETGSEEVRLNIKDADFIDILHTNSQPFIPLFGFGLIRPHGDVDFYINGGTNQPGCRSPLTKLKELGETILEAKSIGDLVHHSVEDMTKFMCCSHIRSYIYFTEALSRNCSMWGQKVGLIRKLLDAGTEGLLEPLLISLEDCTADTCLPVGLDTPLFKARGTFSVRTNTKRPYCSDDNDINKASNVLQKLSDEVHDRGPLLQTKEDENSDGDVPISVEIPITGSSE